MGVLKVSSLPLKPCEKIFPAQNLIRRGCCFRISKGDGAQGFVAWRGMWKYQLKKRPVVL